MLLQINGEKREMVGAATLAELIALLGMQADRVAVELDREIVPRAQWEQTPLHEGALLEIVHFVGGG